MQIEFWGFDFGPFVFGRRILKSFPSAKLEFFVGQMCPGKGLSESDFWELAVVQILSETRFGRIGIVIDRKNTEAHKYFGDLDVSKFAYRPKDSRAQRNPKCSIFEVQLMKEMANEGCADTVEFRRLSRKYIRNVKHHHCDILFFPEAIFGDDKTRKILQHIAGTQLRCVFTSDYIMMNKDIEQCVNNSKTRSIKIYSEDTKEFTMKIAEDIMRTKLKSSDIILSTNI